MARVRRILVRTLRYVLLTIAPIVYWYEGNVLWDALHVQNLLGLTESAILSQVLLPGVAIPQTLSWTPYALAGLLLTLFGGCLWALQDEGRKLVASTLIQHISPPEKAAPKTQPVTPVEQSPARVHSSQVMQLRNYAWILPVVGSLIILIIRPTIVNLRLFLQEASFAIGASLAVMVAAILVVRITTVIFSKSAIITRIGRSALPSPSGGLITDRYNRLLNTVSDEELRMHLRIYGVPNTDGRADARDSLYSRVVELFRHLKFGQRQPHERMTVEQTEEVWIRLANDIHCTSECLWLGLFTGFNTLQEARRETRDEIDTIRLSVRMSYQLMLIWLEARLFRMRSYSNEVIRSAVLPEESGDNPTRQTIRRFFKGKHGDESGYLTIIHGWDEELSTLTGQTFFQNGPNAIPQLKAIIQEFGPNHLNEDDEGWAAQAVDAEAELRYQLFDEVRRERWRTHKYWYLSWLLYTLLKFTTGYGTRPVFFLRTALFVLLGFTGAFFLNDFLNPGISSVTSGTYFCSESRASDTNWHSWSAIAHQIVKYFYLAITSLTSLGSDSRLASYCGGLSTQILLMVAALTGYFMLALLASLFFNLLREPD